MITWKEAELELRKNIRLNSHLDQKHNYKIVISVPPKSCNRQGEEGFIIQVGAKSRIDVPFEMLQVLFDESIKNGGIYNNSVFRSLYPQKLSNKPCYVQSIGMLFEHAGVAKRINKREFQIT